MALLLGLVHCPLSSQASAVQSREDEWPAGPAVTPPALWQAVWGLRCGATEHRLMAGVQLSSGCCTGLGMSVTLGSGLC